MTPKHLIMATPKKLLKILAIFVFALSVILCPGSYATADAVSSSGSEVCTELPSKLETKLRKKLGTKFLTYEGCAQEMGAWYMLPMPEEEDRMQAVHAALLPNSKVLIVNGSSNRNHVTAEGKIEDDIGNSKYPVINNTSIFDPSLSDFSRNNRNPDFTTSPFERIASPPAVVNGEINDLFCSGHLQLPSGDVLFVGGTRRYYPGVKFEGSRNANIFHWKAQEDEEEEINYTNYPWENIGLTKDGHWYPTLIPLADGKIASFSGLTIDPSQIISTLVEIYDPENKEEPWQSIDIKNYPNNPFITRMNDVDFDSDLIDLYARILPTKEF